MLVTRGQLEPLLPHAGAMVMIDGVCVWDDRRIRCVSLRHRSPDNPLRRDGRLFAHHAIEFAAQAAAVHGGLLGGGEPAPLRALAAVRRARFARPRLDDLEDQLEIVAELILLDRRAAVYHADITHRRDDVASMRLTLMTIDQEIPPP
jgi:predicted hotdog family 3-hydroxylacyl-ACP dehydratase